MHIFVKKAKFSFKKINIGLVSLHDYSKNVDHIPYEDGFHEIFG